MVDDLDLDYIFGCVLDALFEQNKHFGHTYDCDFDSAFNGRPKIEYNDADHEILLTANSFDRNRPDVSVKIKVERI